MKPNARAHRPPAGRSRATRLVAPPDVADRIEAGLDRPPDADTALEAELDEALAATFPASDPVAVEPASAMRARDRVKAASRG